MTENEVLSAVRNQLTRCAGFDGDEEATAREKALNYYFQRPRGDEVAGRSHYVSGDVSAMVEANLAQMLDAFSSDSIAEFEPLGAEDETQAQLESDAVRYFVMSKSNGFTELAMAIKDALLLRNGVMKVWVEEKTQTRTKSFTDVSPEALVELTNQPGVETKVLKYDPEARTLQLRITRRSREFQCRALPIENFLYIADYDSLNLQDIPFCAERHVDRRSDLILLGFPKSKVEGLTAHRTDYKTDANARNPRKQSVDSKGVDKSQDPIEWYECYVLIDKDGDGISERRKICISGETLLSDEPAFLVPYAAGTAILNPHRFKGISLYDKLKQVQDMNTGLGRALFDNVNTVTKNRIAYLDGKANVDDVSDGRTNGAIRVKPNVADIRTAIMPFQVPDNSVSILQNIEFQNRQRAELGGAALDMQTAQMQIGGDRMGSQGLDRAFSVMEQLASMMTKNIAATLIRSTFLLAHATLREWFDEPVPVKRNGQWESPIPSKWPERHCVQVKPGMSPGERTRRANTLMQILNSQIALAEKGMDEVLVNIDGFYKTLMDWARISEVQNPEQYFVDPQSPQARQAMQSKQAAAQQQEQMKKALMQQAIGLEQLRTALDKYAGDADRQFKYYDAVLKAEIEEAKIAGKATTELLKAKQQGKEQANGPKDSSAAAPKERAAARNPE